MEPKPQPTPLRTYLSIFCLLIASLALAAKPIPILAQAQTDSAPSGWLLAGSQPENYRTGIDRSLMHDGQPSAYLRSAVPEPTGFATLMQSISAVNYAGKRVRLRAAIQTQNLGGWAGLWMRVDKQQTPVAFDNMHDRALKGTQPWSPQEVVLDVPEDATGISFGLLLSGPGEAWLNHMTFEVVGKEISVTSPASPTPAPKPPLPATPVNLTLSE
jgi:hypothetical protein